MRYVLNPFDAFNNHNQAANISSNNSKDLKVNETKIGQNKLLATTQDF